MEKDRILITGGSGFIGSNLFRYLQNTYDCELLNVDKALIADKNIMNFTEICDIRDYEKLRQIIMGFNPNYIIHLAARTDLDGKSIGDYSSNTAGVRNIVEVAKELTNLKRMLITSSMLVCKAGYQPKSNDDYSPTTLYGESKVLTERITIEAHPGSSYFFLRPTSIWGPGFKVPYRNFFDMVMKRRYFHIGHRSCTKTYGYIGNTVYQIEKILFTKEKIPNGEVFYLGDPALNIEDWANSIARYLKIKIPYAPYSFIKILGLLGDGLKKIGISFPMSSFRLKNMTTNNIIDLTKTFKVAPKIPYSIDRGIEKTIEWIKSEAK